MTPSKRRELYRALAKDYIVRGLTVEQIRVKRGIGRWTIERAIQSVNPWTLEPKAAA